MSKQILFSNEARAKLYRGIEILANAVRATLGPKGRNVVIEKPFVAPHVTKDGVTVAKEVSLKDSVENMGATMLRQAASTTGTMAGDGTTTSTVLAASMISQGIDLIEKEHANPIDLKKGMTWALTKVLDALKTSKHLEAIDLDSHRLAQVGTISANNDRELGKLIAEAIQSVGVDGLVTVQESTNTETSVVKSNGIYFNKGYMSSQFITNKDKAIIEYDNPLILFIDESVRDIQRLVPFIEFTHQPQINRPIVFIADDIIEQALNMMVLNVQQKGLKIAAVKAPSFGDNRKVIMKDMALACGGLYISDSEGLDLGTISANPTLSIMNDIFGQAERIVIKKNETTIIGGLGDDEDIKLRISQIKEELTQSNIPDHRKQMEDRIARLSGGVAVISVGASTEMEMKEKKDRVDDAVAATKAALEEGIVPGGGYMLMYISELIFDHSELTVADQIKGYDLVMHALRQPLYAIMDNAGYDEDVASIQIDNNWDEEGIGFDALEERWVNLKENGIIDPVKVIRVALENAVSVASTILTTNVTINMDPEDKPREIGGFPGF